MAGARSEADVDRRPNVLGKISKRGNRYLRVLFVQAAWIVLIKPKSWEYHGLKPWLEAAKKRLHHNVLAIALANKLARIRVERVGAGSGLRSKQASGRLIDNRRCYAGHAEVRRGKSGNNRIGTNDF